ncbi:MAG TPA: serine--tRNA ligase [Candidatus Acidoferrum sp.]|nr:serine--tRNA ligase [Candidatus Acidoferrum sp.]
MQEYSELALPYLPIGAGPKTCGSHHWRADSGLRYASKTMHDLNYFRDHLDEFADMAKRRNTTLDLDGFRALDKERRELIRENEERKAQRNKASDEIARLKKAKESADTILAEMKLLSEKIKQSDERINDLDARQRDFLLTIPNIPDKSVPYGKGSEGNQEVRRWGTAPKFDFQPKPHWEVGEKAGILDLEAAARITGARFAVYKSWGARLERALANFFLDVHTREHGYTEILPPFLVNTASLMGAGQLPKFAADLFKLQDTDFWLTPTSEVELHNLYRDTTLTEEQLPICVTAWTACFRSEAGAAGKDTRGILRQHQFQKVELFKFTHPEKSYEEHEALVRNAETILQKLGLHYRTMLLCSGDMGFASSKTYDLEVWLPSSNEFREISSCSNCEAFQARRAGIRFKPKGGGKSDFVHTLNGSGLAVGRTWIAIVENYQQADGSIVIPEVLRPYMGIDRIPALA